MSEENKSPLDGAIWHHMDAATIAGFGPWVRHADHVAEIERLRAKLAKAVAARDAVIAIMDSAIASDEASKKRLASAKEVIAPFAEFGRSHTDEHGWIDGFGNERLCNWIGPSDLRAAAEWMEKGDE